VKHFRRLLDTQAAEKAELDDVTLPLIAGRQGFQREVQRDDVNGRFGRPDRLLVERYLLRPGAALLKAPGSGVIHKNAAHQLGRDAKEMRAILPSKVLRAGQPNEGFIDQCCRLKGMVAPLAGHVSPSQSPELGLDEGEQVLERLGIAVTPCSK